MKICFLGDVFCETPDSLRAWPDELQADCAVLNFEYVYDNGRLDGRNAAEGKINLKGNGTPFLPGFRKYVAVLANNHALDYSDAGVDSTMQFIRAHGAEVTGVFSLRSGHQSGPIVIGDGVSLSAYLQRHLITSLADSCHWRQNVLDEKTILDDAREAMSRGSRFHVVFLHWGTELLSKPWPNQVEMAHRLIDSGLVQMIVGMHSHCIQSHEMYNGRHIFYGLGNCVFPNYRKMPSMFQNGVAYRRWYEYWSELSNRSLAVLFDTTTKTVEVKECVYSRKGCLIIRDNPTVSSDVVISWPDCRKALWRRFMTGVRLMGMWRFGLARWHFRSAMKSRRSYRAFFSKEYSK